MSEVRNLLLGLDLAGALALRLLAVVEAAQAAAAAGRDLSVEELARFRDDAVDSIERASAKIEAARARD